MEKNSLVILRHSQTLFWESDVYYPNRIYRCLKWDENECSNWLVGGENFNQEEFDTHFMFLHDKVIADWKACGLIVNDKLVSKRKFREMADIHKYGKYRIIFFGNYECMYGFYPKQDTIINNINDCYYWFKDTVLGNMTWFDDKDIQFGSRGIPMTYGDMRSWH